MWLLLAILACVPEPVPKDLPAQPCIPAARWYPDADGDGHGNVRAGVDACDAPSGYVANGDDCNDLDPELNPETAWFIDADTDGFGAPPVLEACSAPFGYVRVDGDCDDGQPDSWPGNSEICDGIDNDCDGLDDDDDDDVAGQRTWYPDLDGDGYGVWEGEIDACEQPEGYAFSPNDCDDADSTIYWGAEEACGELIDRDCDGVLAFEDVDGDGHPSCVDCDDLDATVNADADERCGDNLDNNCDNAIDDAGAIDVSTFYDDDDGDGWGDATDPILGCRLPANAVPTAGDCDDRDADRHPDADESCDGEDEDCDGLTDEDAAEALTWYEDGDADGYGGGALTDACTAPPGSVSTGGDCDDNDGAIHPAASERCDWEDRDEDCDGHADDADTDATGAEDAWMDLDHDGYGTGPSLGRYCTLPEDSSAADGDCDDDDGSISPGAIEICDGVDADCDSLDDDVDAVDSADYYPDSDQDGYGTYAVDRACVAPSGHSERGGDCEDTNPDISPGVSEICNGLDDNCDSVIDEETAVDATWWYDDDDGDGLGDTSDPVPSCRPLPDRLDEGGDCDDTDPAVNILSAEVCDPADADENCNGTSDDEDPLLDLATTTAWPYDGDGDGFGDPSATVLRCDEGSDAAGSADDCDDIDAEIHPGAVETCGEADEDCDGLLDDEDPDLARETAVLWYTDLDGDGFGDPASPQSACSAPGGLLAGVAVADNADDCDDSERAIHAGADEHCDTVDADCDGEAADPDAQDLIGWYADLDGDGFGAGVAVYSCEAPDAHVDNPDDCDDLNEARHPDRPEDTCNGEDDDCDGGIDLGATEAWYDGDRDGFGDASLSLSACGLDIYAANNAEDCDDTDASAYPGAPDAWGDAVDQNCDESLSTDADEDGVEIPLDCNDADPAVKPYALELPDDGIDNDCDGQVDGDDPVTWLSFSDEEAVELTFADFSFDFCDQRWTRLQVHADGLLIFGDDEPDDSPSTWALARLHAIAPLWADLDPVGGGGVAWEEDADHASFWWEEVPTSAGSVSFGVTLESDGTARFEYGGLDVTDTLVGWSCAPGLAFRETDLLGAQGHGWVGGGTEEALAEVYGAGDPIPLSDGWLRICATAGSDTDGDGVTGVCGDEDEP